MRPNRRRIGLIALAALALVVALAVVFWQMLIRIVIVAAAMSLAGVKLSFGHLDVYPSHLSAANVHVENVAGEPIADVGKLELNYSLRDLLPGGARMYGLSGFDFENAHVTVIRHKDGTFNVPIPKTRSAAPSSVPYVFDGRIRNVSVDLYDRAQGVPAARHLIVRNIYADLAIATNARSHYRAGFAYVEDGQAFPVDGYGDVDVPGGVGAQRWRATQLPIARIVDVALNSPSFHMVGGSLRNVDARIVALPDRAGSLRQHLSATTTIDRARIAIGGLAKPLRDVEGELAVYGNGLLLQDVNATIAGVPIHLGGGIYGFGSPSFRLTVGGTGNLRDLRGALAQSASLPLTGLARLDVMVEGAPSKPLTLIALRSPRAVYASVPVDAPGGLLAFDGQEIDVIDFGARYGGIELQTRGRLNIHPKPRAVEIVAGFDSPAGSLPYADALVPGMPLHGSVVAIGDRPSRVDARGIVAGTAGAQALAAAFDLWSNGVGTIGPVRIEKPHQSLYAIAAVDGPHHRFDGYVDASNLRLSTTGSRAASLPGLRLAEAPPLAATLDARVVGNLHDGRLQVAGDATARDVRTPLANVARANVAFGRTPQSPLEVAMNAGGIGALGAVAIAALSYDRGTVRVTNAAAASHGTLIEARGNVSGLQSGAPRYDLVADVHSADIAPIAKLVQPKTAGLIEGSAEARMHVAGSGTSPSIAGTVAFPEGAVNGLAFHDLDAAFAGTAGSLALRNGRVGVGSTDVAFAGSLSVSAQRVNVSAPRADLQDFNDFFDPGDMLAGRGRIRATVALTRGTVVATSGDVSLHGAKVRSFDLGTTDVVWSGSGRRIVTSLAFGGESGRVRAWGTVGLYGTVNMVAHARDVDLARWLPMAGFVVPVTGIAQADVTASGRYPNLDSRVSARVDRGTVGRVPLQELTVAATTRGGRGRVTEATLSIPNARVTGSGTFGLHPDDPLGLAFHATTPDVAAAAKTLLGRTFDAAGALDTTLRVGGSREHPKIDDDFVLTSARYGRFDVPRAAGHVRVDSRDVALSGGEIDLRHGRLLANATLPIRLIPFRIDEQNRPVAGSIVADGVDASNVAALLPTGTKFGGRLDGRVDLSGTVRAPRLDGTMTFADGTFSGPQESVPITAATAQLAFSGSSIVLQNARANAGGGTFTADGRAAIPDLHDPRLASLALNLHARGLQLDMPQYIKGRFDGDLSLTRDPGSRPVAGGTVSVNSARIPLTALYNPKASSGPAPALPDLGLDLHVNVGRDVRVVSPNVDVGAQGSVHVMGSLQSPSLAGSFASTGGTVSFLREFRVQQATVTFEPSSGIVPTVDATATTYVADPPTNVALRVNGLATNLNLTFASDPTYDREQILGLLVNAQAFGAVRGVSTTGNTSFSAGSAITTLAAGQLNTLFTRNLLEPLSVALGGSLGLQNLQITNDIQGGLGVNAVKTIGKNVDFIFAQTFNQPRRTAWTVQANPNVGTQYQLTAYTSQDTQALGYQPILVQNLNYGNSTTIPLDTGTNGIDFKYRRKFP